MVETRSMRKKRLENERRKKYCRTIYRERTKSSHCRGLTVNCVKRNGCKKTHNGKRKSYCRKLKNKSI